MKPLKVAVIFAAGIVVGAVFTVRAAQTNYLGTVFLADPTTLTHQLAINADGSLNVDCK